MTPVRKPRIRKAETVRDRTTNHNLAKPKTESRHLIRRFMSLLLTLLKFLLKPLTPLLKPLKFIGRFLIPKYIRNSVRELRLVDWPTSRQTWKLTFAVLIFATTFGFLVVVTDYGLDKVIRRIVLR